MRRLAIFTVCLLALAACASADVFTFTYTGTNVVTDTFNPTPSTNDTCAHQPGSYCTGASGQLVATFVSGVQWQVISGSGTYTDSHNNLLTIDVRLGGAGSDGYFSWDNIAQPTFNPLLTNGGLLFDVSNGQELNIYGWGPGQLYDAITAPPKWGGDAGGFSLTHVDSVPDGGMTLMLLGGALTGIAMLRRKLRA